MVQTIISKSQPHSQSTKLTKDEIVDFEQIFEQIVKDLISDGAYADIPETLERLEAMMYYNVPHGKKVRGLMVPMTYKCLVESPSEEDMKLAYVLGWCIEILQASFLIADDIMDGSETRRGRPCWYKVKDMGVIAVNDSYILEHTVYEILEIYFKNKSYHHKLVSLFLKATYQTVLGQSLDTKTGQERDMDDYTMERYSAIVKHKTSYYTTYLPIALTMAMAGITDSELWKKMEEITLDIGYFFQVQDDYLDCFGDEEVTGKIGTDIQDCKCSWLFVTAKNKCTPEQLSYLKEIYGTEDNRKIQEVKSLYRTLGIPEEYEKYEEDAYARISTKIKEVEDRIPDTVFYNLLGLICNRKK